MKRILGSAHTGTGEWLLQRLTALYVAAFVIYLVARFTISPITQFAQWQAWFASGFVRAGLALFFLSTLVHAWIGMRIVYMDYVRALWLRFIFSLVTALVLIGLGFRALFLLLQ